jgi:endonuclease YncB( thermonuclease family)
MFSGNMPRLTWHIVFAFVCAAGMQVCGQQPSGTFRSSAAEAMFRTPQKSEEQRKQELAQDRAEDRKQRTEANRQSQENRAQPTLELGTIPEGQTVLAKVVGVTDGDTVSVLADATAYRIRLDGIDAPESNQPFGQRSRQVLADKIFGKTVEVISRGQDRYGRTLGIIRQDGTIVNAAMVAEGWAWHYKQYSDSKVLAAAEDKARAGALGLWAHPDPVPPWEFRKTPKPEALSETAVDTGDAPAPEPGDAPAPTAQSEAKYWLTTSSGIRHNLSCRHYATSKGRSCGKADGRACKICGG